MLYMLFSLYLFLIRNLPSSYRNKVGLSTKLREPSWLPQSFTLQRYDFFLVCANKMRKKAKKTLT